MTDDRAEPSPTHTDIDRADIDPCADFVTDHAALDRALETVATPALEIAPKADTDGMTLVRVSDALPPELANLPRFKIHADGVYFGLNAADYHADPALGSSDMARLIESPAAWWWDSVLNPNRDADDDTPAKAKGRAMHVRVCEGETAFRHAYRVAPRPEDHPGCLVTADDLKGYMRTNGIKPLTGIKAELIERIRTFERETSRASVIIFDELVAAFEAGAAQHGATVIKADLAEQVERDAAYILADPVVRNAFVSGAAEVSVFWTCPDTGVRSKMRLDYLRPHTIVDLKGVANTQSRPFDEAVALAITQRRLDIQARHYMDGWAHLVRAASSSEHVFGDCPLPSGWGESLSRPEDVAFTWIFHQTTGAPLVRVVEAQGSARVFARASREIAEAKANFQKCQKTFGLWRPWRDDVAPRVLAESDLPVWFAKTLSVVGETRKLEAVA